MRVSCVPRIVAGLRPLNRRPAVLYAPSSSTKGVAFVAPVYPDGGRASPEVYPERSRRALLILSIPAAKLNVAAFLWSAGACSRFLPPDVCCRGNIS